MSGGVAVDPCTDDADCTVLRIDGAEHHLNGPQVHWLAAMLAVRQGRELSVMKGRLGRG